MSVVHDSRWVTLPSWKDELKSSLKTHGWSEEEIIATLARVELDVQQGRARIVRNKQKGGIEVHEVAHRVRLMGRNDKCPACGRKWKRCVHFDVGL